MKKNKKVLRHGFGAIIAALTIAVFAISQGFPTASTSTIFPRPEDAIVIAGREIKPATGANISKLSLAAIHGGKVEAIPFQIDELRDGVHVFDWVAPAGVKLGLYDKDTDGGIFDADDEIAFMAWDLGEKAGQKGQFAAQVAAELAVTDPNSGKTAYAYLLVDSTIPRSAADYVQLKLARPRYNISTQRYQYSSIIEYGYFDLLKLRNAGGAWTPNLVVRNKAPGKAVTRIGLKMDFDFYALIRGDVMAYKDGPIRAFWRVAGGADFGMIKIKAKGSAEPVFYANRMDQPLNMDLPFNFDSLLKSFEMGGTLLMDPKAAPVTYFDSYNRNGIRMPGAGKSPGNIPVGDKPRDWFVLSVNGASVYFLGLFSPDWQPRLKRTLATSETQAGLEIGSNFGDMVHLLTKGKHEYIIRYYILPNEFKWGDEKLIPEINGKSLKITTNSMK